MSEKSRWHLSRFFSPVFEFISVLDISLITSLFHNMACVGNVSQAKTLRFYAVVRQVGIYHDQQSNSKSIPVPRRGMLAQFNFHFISLHLFRYITNRLHAP